MRRSLVLALVSAVSVAGVAAASPVSGTWRTPVHNSLIQVYDCGGAVCGRVLTSDLIKANPGMKDAKDSDASRRDLPIKGMVIMTGFTGGPTEWSGGQIYNPDDGHTYHGSIRLTDPATLDLKGCVFGPLCKTQTWHKVS